MFGGKPLVVRATWDDETRVWVVTSEDVPGLRSSSKPRSAE